MWIVLSQEPDGLYELVRYRNVRMICLILLCEFV